MITIEQAELGIRNKTKFRILNTCNQQSVIGTVGTIVERQLNKDWVIFNRDGSTYNWLISLKDLEPINDTAAPKVKPDIIMVPVPKSMFGSGTVHIGDHARRFAAAQMAVPLITDMLSKNHDVLTTYDAINDIINNCMHAVSRGFK